MEVVVPSLATRSCVILVSITSFAVGCSTLAVSRTVAPSLVIRTSPSWSMSILSIPFGPNVDLTAAATAKAALAFPTSAALPVTLSVSWRVRSSSGEDTTIRESSLISRNLSFEVFSFILLREIHIPPPLSTIQPMVE